MPFYEYRPKSGECGICGGCFVDLQKMSDPAHGECPDCGKACERVISAPIVSVRGSEYKAAANRENRAESMARAVGENAKLRRATEKKYGQIAGHTHNCALAGCYGEKANAEACAGLGSGASDEAGIDSVSSGRSEDSRASGEAASPRRFGSFPHLVGGDE